MADRKTVLPDVLAPSLKIVFCGTAPGTVSAARKQYYAHPQNKFWRTLQAVRLTPRLLLPEEYGLLSLWGIGLTDIAKHVFGMDSELPPGSLGRLATEDLRARIARVSPRVLAFTSLTGGKRFLGPRAKFGAQKETIGPTRIWVLPSPSPAAHWNWDERPWRELAREVG